MKFEGKTNLGEDGFFFFLPEKKKKVFLTVFN